MAETALVEGMLTPPFAGGAGAVAVSAGFVVTMLCTGKAESAGAVEPAGALAVTTD
jgi:hypothetical protein